MFWDFWVGFSSFSRERTFKGISADKKRIARCDALCTNSNSDETELVEWGLSRAPWYSFGVRSANVVCVVSQQQQLVSVSLNGEEE